jgi:hypothetical protein
MAKTEIAKQLAQERKQEQQQDAKERQRELRTPPLRTPSPKTILQQGAENASTEKPNDNLLPLQRAARDKDRN